MRIIILFAICLIISILSVYSQSTSDSLKAWKKETAAYIKQNAKPIKSLTDTSLADLKFLAKELKGKQVVLLGESSHTTQEYNQLKGRLIRYLSQELGFKTLIIESGVISSIDILKTKDTVNPKKLLYKIFSQNHAWYNYPNLELVSFLQKDKNFQFFGFDMANFPDLEQRAYIKRLLDVVDIKLYPIIQENDSLLNNVTKIWRKERKNGYIVPDSLKRKFNQDFNYLLQRVKQDTIKLRHYGYETQEIKIIIRYLENHLLYSSLAYFSIEPKQRFNLRDSLNAENIKWIMEELVPKQKIIIWAHNSHIAKHAIGGKHPTGEVLQRKMMSQQIYALGLYMYEGEKTSFYKKNKEAVIKAPIKSIEEAIIQSGFEITFLNTHPKNMNKKNKWVFESVSSLYWGSEEEEIIPFKTYDGLILIKKVSVADYIWKE